jgi:hypothetical protein
LNVFGGEADKDIDQIKCFAHVANLFLKHALEDDPFFKEALNAIHEICVKVGGGRRSLEILEEACKAAGIAFKHPLNAGATRWNINEAVLCRYVELKEGIYVINVDLLYQGAKKKSEKITKFKNNVAISKKAMSFLKEVIPFLTRVAQWVQVLSSNTWVTLSLVRLAVQDIKSKIDAIGSKGRKLSSKFEVTCVFKIFYLIIIFNSTVRRRC